ncbi:hypothetical protein K5E11_06160 [Acinetobacter pittii]|uniref:hypothetical protein n=1 Tax=Acinetobacter pittii TaxID=48296 RepID=UPI001FF20B7D|nr:hypothetical protein [Acinetobacter pittii]MCJ9040903.1 hypothetical protein [Acinetobacter pittii]HEE6562225.1 hypothetical protein [Acinetobacter baumannii]
MQFIKNSFADKVRSNKIKSPLRTDFSLEKWETANKLTEFDKRLYEAGLYFHSQFNCIRDHLKQLNKTPTSITKEDYLKIFIGMSNHDAKVNIENVKKIIPQDNPPTLDINFYGIQTSNNVIGNLYSLNETAMISVDGIFYNIISHLSDDSKKEKTNLSQENIFKHIRIENLLSQLYYSYEQYWNSILYEQITYEITEEKLLLRDNPEIMVPFQINDIRNSKIRANNIILGYAEYMEFLRDQNYAYLIFKDNQFSYQSFRDLESKNQQQIITCLNSFADETIEFIPNTLPNLNFNIDEVISIFVQLSSLSYGILNSLDSDTSILNFDYNKFKNFSKTLNLTELCDYLAFITSIEKSKVSQIIDFLTFTHERAPGPRVDLWRFPIVKVNKDECLLVLEPLLHPVGLRCFEGWMAKAEVEIAQKGTSFENHIKTELNELFTENPYIEKSDFFEEDIISIDGEQEEIDLLFKIGNLIVLGEAKCVVTTDSAISVWNTIETIKHASEQAIRKLNFVSRNFKRICKKLNWLHDENLEYNFCPIVVISNGFGAGNSFFGVPIIDHKILSSYFKNGYLPLISTDKGEDLAYLKIYNSSEELQSNFSAFISKPPTIETYKISINYLIPISLISCKDQYKKLIEHTRLGVSNVTEQQILDHNYGYELVILDSLESYLAKA